MLAAPVTTFAEAEGFEVVAEFTEIETCKGSDAAPGDPVCAASAQRFRSASRVALTTARPARSSHCEAAGRKFPDHGGSRSVRWSATNQR